MPTTNKKQPLVTYKLPLIVNVNYCKATYGL